MLFNPWKTACCIPRAAARFIVCDKRSDINRVCLFGIASTPSNTHPRP